ncbi:MAG: DUF350 domain-containing protein [Pseudomonadota bacterium]
MEVFGAILISEVLATIIYTFLGLFLFLACFWIIDKVTHFSLEKEIIDEHNTAVAILMGAVAIALALIIAAVIT